MKQPRLSSRRKIAIGLAILISVALIGGVGLVLAKGHTMQVEVILQFFPLAGNDIVEDCSEAPVPLVDEGPYRMSLLDGTTSEVLGTTDVPSTLVAAGGQCAADVFIDVPEAESYQLVLSVTETSDRVAVGPVITAEELARNEGRWSVKQDDFELGPSPTEG